MEIREERRDWRVLVEKNFPAANWGGGDRTRSRRSDSLIGGYAFVYIRRMIDGTVLNPMLSNPWVCVLLVSVSSRFVILWFTVSD